MARIAEWFSKYVLFNNNTKTEFFAIQAKHRHINLNNGSNFLDLTISQYKHSTKICTLKQFRYTNRSKSWGKLFQFDWWNHTIATFLGYKNTAYRLKTMKNFADTFIDIDTTSRVLNMSSTNNKLHLYTYQYLLRNLTSLKRFILWKICVICLCILCYICLFFLFFRLSFCHLYIPALFLDVFYNNLWH